MTVRSARLVGPVSLGTGPSDLATVPGAERWIVKSVRLVNTSGADEHVWLTVNGDDEQDALFWDAVVPAGQIVSDATWWVLMPGDVLREVCSDAPAITIWMSGARLAD